LPGLSLHVKHSPSITSYVLYGKLFTASYNMPLSLSELSYAFDLANYMGDTPNPLATKLTS